MGLKIFLTHSIIAIIAYIVIANGDAPKSQVLGWLIIAPVLTWPLMVIAIIWI